MAVNNATIPVWVIRFLSTCMAMILVIVMAAVPFAYSLKVSLAGVTAEVRSIQKTLDRHERVLEKINNGRKH